jgi:hypothetical protein
MHLRGATIVVCGIDAFLDVLLLGFWKVIRSIEATTNTIAVG